MRLMLTVAVLCSGGVAALPPVDHFTRYPDYEQARISPTGDYLAVTTKMDDFEYLTVIELARNEILYRTHFGKNWDVADFHWATAERILVQPAVRIPGRTDFSFRPARSMASMRTVAMPPCCSATVVAADPRRGQGE